MANILIVDDQPYLGELVSEELSRGGHRVKCVEEGWRAIEELRSNRPDIVLLDLFLQGFEGWDLVHLSCF
jgi:DNA-binding response OmpR family regulator